MFFDVHSHVMEAQSGGLLLSIEGNPPVPGGKTFQAWQVEAVPDTFVVVPYVHDLNAYIDSKIVYIHPRRNRFSLADVSGYLKKSAARIVVLDTFYKFTWNVSDYVAIIRQFPQKTILLAHGGGYDIREMIQMVRYHENCWIDFSATHSIFGLAGGDARLDCGVKAAILHALAEPRIHSRVLFGSDNPEFSQAQSLAFYASLGGDTVPRMTENYQRFIAPYHEG